MVVILKDAYAPLAGVLFRRFGASVTKFKTRPSCAAFSRSGIGNGVEIREDETRLFCAALLIALRAAADTSPRLDFLLPGIFGAKLFLLPGIVIGFPYRMTCVSRGHSVKLIISSSRLT